MGNEPSGDYESNQSGARLTEYEVSLNKEAQYTPDIAAALDGELDQIRQAILDATNSNTSVAQAILTWHKQHVDSHASRIAASMLVQVVEQWGKPTRNPTVKAWGLRFAANLDSVMGKTMTEVAKELGVTRAAISKSANAWCDALNLPRSQYMKSQAARASYSGERRENHWRSRGTHTPNKESPTSA
jgi:hypothetical protein